jgi:CMP-N,N'-diacetyllegionaminic acid synthase
MMGQHPVSVLAVIPARGGSRGVPRKNLQEVDGVSLVGLAARVALASPSIAAAVLSTDDPEIASVGRSEGLEVPFMRPPALAADDATAVDTWRHAWLETESATGRSFEVSVLLEPSSPLRRVSDIEETVRTLLTGDHAAAATFSRTPAHYTPHKSFTIDGLGRAVQLLGPQASQSIRQRIPTLYHRNGLCYAVRRETLLHRGTIVEEGCAMVVTERQVVNIDEPFDLELARWIRSRESRSAQHDLP